MDISNLVENPDSDIEEWMENIEDVDLSGFHRPTDLKPQSAGSFLWGNRQSYYGDVNRECSPLAIGSLGYTGYCSCSVWHLHKNILKQISGSGLSDAYIFVDNDWSEFSQEQIEQLSEAGIEEAAVFITQNSIHQKIIEMQPITDFIVSEVKHKRITKETYTRYFLLIILLGIAILFVSSKYLFLTN